MICIPGTGLLSKVIFVKWIVSVDSLLSGFSMVSFLGMISSDLVLAAGVVWLGSDR